MVSVTTENETRTRDLSVTLAPNELIQAIIDFAAANGDAANQLPADFAMDDDDAFKLSYKTAANFAPTTVFENGHNPAFTLSLDVTETD